MRRKSSAFFGFEFGFDERAGVAELRQPLDLFVPCRHTCPSGQDRRFSHTPAAFAFDRGGFQELAHDRVWGAISTKSWF
jgi:hypothetical protein